MPTSIDLRPERLRTVQSILRTFVPNREVRAFGSRVTGKAKPMSDLDLCIMGGERLPAGVYEQLTAAFSDSTLPFKVDIVVWAAAGDGFRAAINQATLIVQALPKD